MVFVEEEWTAGDCAYEEMLSIATTAQLSTRLKPGLATWTRNYLSLSGYVRLGYYADVYVSAWLGPSSVYVS